MLLIIGITLSFIFNITIVECDFKVKCSETLLETLHQRIKIPKNPQVIKIIANNCLHLYDLDEKTSSLNLFAGGCPYFLS